MTRSCTRWWDEPNKLALAYHAEALYQAGADNRHLTWRQVGMLVPDLRTLMEQTRSATQLRMGRRGSNWLSYRQALVSSADVSYVVRAYCTWWGRPYPRRASSPKLSVGVLS